ncbi:unnamed protein product [Peniophora sp. CBMAI 1063]|nr:unnamed protein product [Peniophora sp. CBMAI 1063]
MDSDTESAGSPVPPPYTEASHSGTVLGGAQPSSPRATRSPSPSSVRQARIAAMERRNAEILAAQQAEAAANVAPTFDAFDEDYEKRTEFRRMVEPGIMRPNTREVAVRSLKTLSTLAQNLLKDPDNEKYQSFKTTNSVIKRDLLDPKGTLEYAVEMGFRPEVEDFQPYYKFNKKYMKDLRVGAAVLLEALDVQMTKEEKIAASLKSKKGEEAARVAQAKLQFMDDRKTKALRDQREKQRAAAQAEARHRAELAQLQAARQRRDEP